MPPKSRLVADWKLALEMTKTLAHARGMVVAAVSSSALAMCHAARKEAKQKKQTFHDALLNLLKEQKKYFKAATNSFTVSGSAYIRYITDLNGVLIELGGNHMCTAPKTTKTVTSIGKWSAAEHQAIQRSYFDLHVLGENLEDDATFSLFILFQVKGKDLHPTGVIACAAFNREPGNLEDNMCELQTLPAGSQGDYDAEIEQVLSAADVAAANNAADRSQVLEFKVICTQQHEKMPGGRALPLTAKLFFYIALCTKMVQVIRKKHFTHILVDASSTPGPAGGLVFPMDGMLRGLRDTTDTPAFKLAILQFVAEPGAEETARSKKYREDTNKGRILSDKADVNFHTYVAKSEPLVAAILMDLPDKSLTHASKVLDLCWMEPYSGIPKCL